MIFLLPLASALTLEEAVQRAAEVNPDAVIAVLMQKSASMEETEAWLRLGLTPSLSYDQRYTGGTWSGGLSWQLSTGVLNPSLWMDAGRKHAEAEASSWMATATALDAQYAAAILYYDLLASDARVASARQSVAAAQGTVDAATARVKAGMESELSGKSAELELLSAKALLEQANAARTIAKARLERALQEPVESVGTPPPLTLPESIDSPWIKAMASTVDAARWDHDRRIAGLLPAGYARFGQGSQDVSWHFDIGLTWSLEGVGGPFLKERRSMLDSRIAQVQYEATKLDLELGLTEARENTRAAHAVAEAARLREKVADETLEVGQARLTAGLASVLEVLRLQDQAVQARGDRIEAELNESLALLAARKIAGVPW